MLTKKTRILLSPPHMSGREQAFVDDAFATNWIAPVGPHVDAFEREFASRLGVSHAVALSSGTAALHLALAALKLAPGDDVFCSTLTFAASAFPIVYERATPVFIDSDERTWNMDPALLEKALVEAGERGRLPKAVIAVDLYGQCADLEPIRESCRRRDIPLIEDAAEALGATYKGRPAGSWGWAGIFSFNGNKIITTSGGGMLVTEDGALADLVRGSSQQSRDPAPHYQHSRLGYNYRLSNVLAGIGRGQLEALDERVSARRRNFEVYREELSAVPGITFMPESPDGRSTRWLTCVLIDPNAFGRDREAVRLFLEANGVESRPLWKPMHLQPVFSGARRVGGAVSERLFATGLCLPSGSALTESDVRHVAGLVRTTPRS